MEAEEDPNFFYDNKKFIVIVLTVISFLSLFGSLLIILTYIFFRKIRNYAYKLVTFLSLGDIILTVGNILSIGTIQNEEENSLCTAQAFLVNYGGLVSILWTTIIAWSIYSATVLSAKNLREKNFRFILFGFGVPLIFSVIPFITNQYGRSGFYCWIKNDQTVKDTIMMFAQFYVPLWIALAFNIYAYVNVIRFIKKYISTTLEVRFIHRLKYYPLVLVICWLFGTINRIYNLFGPEVIFLTFLHITLGGLQGFLNAIVYGSNEQVRQIWKEKLCCCCIKSSSYGRYDGANSELKKNEEMQQQQDQEENNHEEMQVHIEEGQNASLELVQARNVNGAPEKKKKGNKLAVRV